MENEINWEQIALEAAELTGAAALLYLAQWWSFSNSIKARVAEEQNGQCAWCGDQTELEFHHIVPANALKGRGIKGKNVYENAVGLCGPDNNDCHEHFDQLMVHGTFYPGVPFEDIDPDTYSVHQRKNKSKGRRR